MTYRITILDIPFDPITEDQAIERILEHLKNDSNKAFFIATPNPEMLLNAQKNSGFRNILQNTDLNIPDGIGILWAATYLNSIKDTKSSFIKLIKAKLTLLAVLFNPKKVRKILPERVTGTDLTQKICDKIPPYTKIFLLGAAEGIAEKAAQNLNDKYEINIVGTDSGAANPANDKKICDIINLREPELLFVAFGAPRQEQWIKRNLPNLPSVKVAIGVGGAFDFISGKTHRAPLFMRKIGLEWFYRLILQPSRIKRIYNATFKFPMVIFKNSIKSKSP